MRDENGAAEVEEEEEEEGEACSAEDAASPQTQMTESDTKQVTDATV